MDSYPDMSEYMTKTIASLPFEGEWIVWNGGRDHEKNGHRMEDGSGPANQMFAYDFTKGHKGEGKALEDYEAFESEVLAPGGGLIAHVTDGRRDVAIGERDEEVPTGNVVVIDHENGEWSVVAHLKCGSVRVKVGERVANGDLLGLCGNSGNTSEPHIHYHLQDGPDLYDAIGLPLWFRDVYVDGQLRRLAEPEGDQLVRNV